MPLVPGLSPRPRGSQDCRGGGGLGVGSIPASAGKPGLSGWRWSGGWVYPRVRGEAVGSPKREIVRSGLSPRPRGSLDRPGRSPRTNGSIPASAGKPHVPHWCLPLVRVYPRVRGEADGGDGLLADDLGLSPRPRGSPRLATVPSSPSAVYPRVRGEAITLRRSSPSGLGLSPRPRGSHSITHQASRFSESIPASAGKPRRSAGAPRTCGVYPRVRGEASPIAALHPVFEGLSPRPRGSREPRRLRAT